MANEINVTAAKPKVAGGIYRAPAGTTLPTDSTTALASAFANVGYISEDGVRNAMEMSTSVEKAWGGDTVNVLEQGIQDSFRFKMLETLNAEAIKTVFGDANVTVTSGAIAVTANSKERGSAVYVVDMLLKNGRSKRIVIPNGSVTELAEITYSDGESSGYEVTILGKSDASGNTHYEYISAPAGE